MNPKDIVTSLSIIHDNLMTIPTSGQGSFTMINCIQELRNIILTLQKQEEDHEKK